VKNRDGTGGPVAEAQERALASIANSALTEIFAAGIEEPVLRSAGGWARASHWRWRRAAGGCLVALARRRGADGWPRLAELIRDQSALYEDVRDMWIVALDRAHSTREAWDALYQWRERSRKEAGRGQAALPGLMDRLLADLRTSSEELADRLAYHQRLWDFRNSRQRLAGTTAS
jgi:hypothetical protein